MYSKAQLKQIIVEEIEHCRSLLNEDVSTWPNVKTILQNNSATPITVDGVETYKFNDPILGMIFVSANGKAYIANNEKLTTWSYSSSNKSVTIDGKQLNLDSKTKSDSEIPSIVYKKKKSARTQETKSAIDILQTALDWLGFIPGFGDIIDAINAIIYFARGKWLDGILSLVAIIPVVGSGIKLGFKGTVEAIGGAWKAERILRKASTGSLDELLKLYKQAIESGQLTAVQLRVLASKGDQIAKLLTSGSAYAKKQQKIINSFGGDATQLGKLMDDTAEAIRNITIRPIEKIQPAGILSKVKRSASSAAGGFFDYAKNTGRAGLALFTGTASESAINLVKKLGFSKKEMELLKRTMDTRYIKQLESRPFQLAGVLKSFQGTKAARDLRAVGIDPNIWRLDSKRLSQWLESLKKSNPYKYKQVTGAIAQRAAKSDNPHYMAFVGDSFQQASNIFRPGAVFKTGIGDSISSIFKLDTYRLSNPKNLDIVSNEIQDLAEELGLDSQDDPQGVIVPAIFYVFNKYILDNDTAVKSVGTKLGGVTAGAGVLTTMGGTIDTALSSIPGGDIVEPESNATVTDMSTIESDFLKAPGTTSQKLQQLETLGWTPTQIETFKAKNDLD